MQCGLCARGHADQAEEWSSYPQDGAAIRHQTRPVSNNCFVMSVANVQDRMHMQLPSITDC